MDNKKIDLNKTEITSNITCVIKEMDLSKLSKTELLVKCEELGIKKCKSKNKSELIELINHKQINQTILLKNSIEFIIEEDKITNNETYKIQNIQPLNKTNNYTLVDLFSGTGAFSYAFQQHPYQGISYADFWEHPLLCL